MAASFAALLVSSTGAVGYIVAQKKLKTALNIALKLPKLPDLEVISERGLVVSAALLLGASAMGGVLIFQNENPQPVANGTHRHHHLGADELLGGAARSPSSGWPRYGLGYPGLSGADAGGRRPCDDRGDSMPAERLLLVGIDHHRSPVELRERLAIGNDQLPDALRELSRLDGVSEATILSTCNRMECYISGDDPSLDLILSWLAERQGCALADLQEHSYQGSDAEAVQHLFRVAASLESLVVGEYQIMNQIRFAYEQGQQADAVGNQLHGLFQAALSSGKRVRNETGIGQHKLSVSSIALDLAEQIHGRLNRCRLLVIGAGEMAELTARHAVDRGVQGLTVINRSRERGEELAALIRSWPNAPEVSTAFWNDLTSTVSQHDIVVSSTASSIAVVTTDAVNQAMTSRRRPLMLIDLAVPRDVETGVADIPNAYLYNIDDLEAVVAQNRQLRQEEVDGSRGIDCRLCRRIRPPTAIRSARSASTKRPGIPGLGQG